MTNKVRITISDESPLPQIEIEEDGVRREFYTDSNDLFIAVSRYLGQLVRPSIRPIHPKMLFSDLDTKTVWWRPPEKAEVIIRLNQDEHQTVTVPMPGLVMMVNERNYRIAAVKGMNRPTEHTALFHAPLPNVNNSHGVCMGLTDRDDGSYVYACEPLWAAYWASAFTSHGTAGKSVKHPDDIRLLLLELDGAAFFPEDDLIPAETTLGEFSR